VKPGQSAVGDPPGDRAPVQPFGPEVPVAEQTRLGVRQFPEPPLALCPFICSHVEH
jgi:hypothetical protein